MRQGYAHNFKCNTVQYVHFQMFVSHVTTTSSARVLFPHVTQLYLLFSDYLS